MHFLLLLLTLLLDGVTTRGDKAKKKVEFRAVEQDYNTRLQTTCGNKEFAGGANPPISPSSATDTDDRAVRQRILGGAPSPRGKHPWATASIFFTIPKCSGALISKRHILTSRPCLKQFPNLYKPFPVRFLLGGVCGMEGGGCPEKDMRDVRVDLAAFTSFPPETNETEKRDEDWGLGILQLSEDLDRYNDTSPLCLPTPEMRLPPSSEPMTVYGWGENEKSALYYTNYALHDAEIPLLSDSDPRYANFSDWCSTLICLGDKARQKFAVYDGDVGGGVLAWRHNVSLAPLLFGSVVHSFRANQNNVTLAASLLRPQLGYAICYYTGVCVKREWVQRRQAGEQPQEVFDVVFDPNDVLDLTTTAIVTTTVEIPTTQPHPVPDDDTARLFSRVGEVLRGVAVLLLRVFSWLLALILSILNSIAATL